MNIEVNYLAIFLAGIISMVVGFVWYSPFLLGKPWAKAIGITMESMKNSQKEMGKYYFLSFITSLITGYVLFMMVVISKSFFGSSGTTTALFTAFWLWLGFVMPVQFTAMLFSGKKIDQNTWTVFAINTGYQLVSLLLMGIAVGMFVG